MVSRTKGRHLTYGSLHDKLPLMVSYDILARLAAKINVHQQLMNDYSLSDFITIQVE